SLPSVVEDGQAMSSERRMHLVAFLKTGPTCHHHGMWRHPESDNDFLDPEWYEHVARVLENGKFDCLFFADNLGILHLYTRRLRHEPQPRWTDGAAGPDAGAGDHGAGHPAHRPRRDDVDDLLQAVPHRPVDRHARPPEPRADGVERGVLDQPPRGAQLRRGAA